MIYMITCPVDAGGESARAASKAGHLRCLGRRMPEIQAASAMQQSEPETMASTCLQTS